MIFPDQFKVPSMFLSVTGLSIGLISNLSHLTVVWSMKFSVVLLSTSAGVLVVPFDEETVTGISSFLIPWTI